MTQEFIKGLIIGGGVMLLLLMLFRDLFLRKIFTQAVPMIQDDKSGEMIELDAFIHEVKERAKADNIQIYRLLNLLKATLQMVLISGENLSEDTKEIIVKKLAETDNSIKGYEKVFKDLGIDVSGVLDLSAFEEFEKQNKTII